MVNGYLWGHQMGGGQAIKTIADSECKRISPNFADALVPLDKALLPQGAWELEALVADLLQVPSKRNSGKLINSLYHLFQAHAARSLDEKSRGRKGRVAYGADQLLATGVVVGFGPLVCHFLHQFSAEINGVKILFAQ